MAGRHMGGWHPGQAEGRQAPARAAHEACAAQAWNGDIVALLQGRVIGTAPYMTNWFGLDGALPGTGGFSGWKMSVGQTVFRDGRVERRKST